MGFGTLLCSASLLLSVSTPGQPKTYRPVAVFSGGGTEITKETYRLIRSAGELRELWAEHRGTGRASAVDDRCQWLEVDFARYQLVAMFAIQASDGCTVPPVIDGDKLTLRFECNGCQIGEGPVSRPKDYTSFCLVVMPRSDKIIEIEQGHRSLIADPPTWKHRATLKPSDTK